MTREEAIKHLQGMRDEAWSLQGALCYINLESIKALDMAIEALTDRPTGEWIDVNGDGSLWRCDQCKDTACCKGDFCPSCGAKMGGDRR